MSIKAMMWAFEQPLQPTQKLVLLAIADCYDDGRDLCFPSSDHLMRKASVSRATMFRVLNELEVGGYLTRQERTSPEGRRMSTIYRLLMSVSVHLHPPLPGGGSQDETVGEGLMGETPDRLTGETPYEPKEEPKRERKSSARGNRLTEGWRPSEAAWNRAVEDIGLQAAQTELEKFTNYWLSKAGRDAVKLNWERTFINWIINAKDRRPNHGTHQQVSGGNRAQRQDQTSEPATVKDRIALIRRAIAEGTA